MIIQCYTYLSKIFVYFTVIIQYIFILYLFKILYQDILFIQDILSRFVGTDEDYIPRF